MTMNYSYNAYHIYKKGEPFDLNMVNNYCASHPNDKIFLQFPNTIPLTSSLIQQIKSDKVTIRIAGAYDDKRIDSYKNQKFGEETVKDYYYNSVIYTKSETLSIMKQIEKIESGIDSSWSELEKTVYIYDKLKTDIMYDPKFESKSSKEVRSLRGLISKETVCAGYALILKEMLDRQHIECDFVRGNGHAWNTVFIDHNVYPLDLTWENNCYRSGNFDTMKYFAPNVEEFNKSHIPDHSEPKYGYQWTLSNIDSELLKNIESKIGINRSNEYRYGNAFCKRNDGSIFFVSQVGDEIIDKNRYFTYFYQDIDEKGKAGMPYIFYGDANLTKVVNGKRWGTKYTSEQLNPFISVIFSKENISDSIKKGTSYLGDIMKKDSTGYVSSPNDINKSLDICSKFIFKTKSYVRSDGSKFVIQEMDNHGSDKKMYQIFSVLNDGIKYVKRHIIYSKDDLMNNQSQTFIDNVLNTSNLDRIVKESKGCVEDTTKKLYVEAPKPQIYSFPNLKKKEGQSLIPTFDELKKLSAKYEIENDEINKNDVIVKDKQTGQIIKEPNLKMKATFANIWLYSAGVKSGGLDSSVQADYAYNDGAEKLYSKMCEVLKNDAKSKGVIDTLSLFDNANSFSKYKYNQDIVMSLFSRPYQTALINKMFLLDANKNTNIDPKTLYNPGYVNYMRHSSMDNQTVVDNSNSRSL